jgi:hypothetical protein
MENLPSQDREIAKLILNPSLQAASTIQHIAGVSENMSVLIDELENHIQALESGDASTIKQAMYGQILTLNKLFHDLCMNGINEGRYGRSYSLHYLTVALKCQRQSMQTAALLSAYLPSPCIEAKGIEQNPANELLTMDNNGDAAKLDG